MIIYFIKNRFLILNIIFSLFFISCGVVSPRFTNSTYPKSVPVNSENKYVEIKNIDSNIPQQKMMDVILTYLGTPYKFGGADSNGIDCSAFTKNVYLKSVGANLPRTTIEQFNTGSQVNIDQIAFGDLLFFNSVNKNPSHVGIYIGDKLFAHASQSSGVTITSIESNYYKKNFVSAKRIIK